MSRLFLPFLVTVMFLLESIIVQLLSQPLFDVYLLVPRMLIVFITFITIFIGQTEGMTYGFVFGLLYDVVYTELLGAYAFAFSLIAYLIAKAMNVLHKNAWTASFFAIVAITCVEWYAYAIQLVIGGTTMSVRTFFQARFLPTLFIHTIVILIIAYPLKQMLLKWHEKRSESSPV
ncbi:rod shape-determining protein MreD [Anoxybacillus flavithermus]|uniref:Rod shape-determining protein MreD n=1 Tax=Anoxybacillus flavithermus TaxID=33934 RepID=A0A2G5RPX8_9BACL|nr:MULTISPECIES: rod shape-determining protein MreD [Anoxybacillus]KFZ42481.1 cell shape-determining protein [Anoxybacillus sp. KU2-6(11)]PIC04807.1 rod shape-determining protein MreD [Anoxybacillus flavithermus]